VQDRLAGTVTAPDGSAVPGPDVRWIGRRHGRRKDRRWATCWSPEQIANRLRVDFPHEMLLHLPRMEGHGGPRANNGPALAGHGAQAVRDAIASSITTLPEQLRKSLTWDQGAEMAQHPRLRIDTALAVYFCDPHSPWQRGTNENTNGLLRQYFPKGTDLSRHSPSDLDAVAAALNSRPRKTLGWRTPAEALNDHLSSLQTSGVASTP
jgi:hypothetical protein